MQSEEESEDRLRKSAPNLLLVEQLDVGNLIVVVDYASHAHSVDSDKNKSSLLQNSVFEELSISVAVSGSA